MIAQKESVAENLQEIEWNDAYSLNVPIIDEEHKKFIKIVNKVIRISNQQVNNNEELAIVLYEMTMYALSHFKTEEKCMRRSEYAEFQLHKNEHNDFIKKTVGFCNRTMDGDYEIIDDLLDYLRLWLDHHIQGTDKNFASFLCRNGIHKCHE